MIFFLKEKKFLILKPHLFSFGVPRADLNVDPSVPTIIKDGVLNKLNIIKIVANESNLAVLTDDGKVFLWGNNTDKAYEVIPKHFSNEGTQSVIKSVAINNNMLFMLYNQKVSSIMIQKEKAYNHMPLLHDDETFVNEIYGKFSHFALVTSENKVIVNYDHTIEIKGNIKKINFTENSMAILQDTTLSIYSLIHSKPEKQSDITDILDVDSGCDRYVVIKTDGKVYEMHTCGDLCNITGYSGVPIKIFGGSKHFGVITYQGECYTWGFGLSGQLGGKKYCVYSTPKKVYIKDLYKILDGVAGLDHTHLLAVDNAFFSPSVPPELLHIDFVRSARIVSTLPSGYIPFDYDIKF